MSVCPVSVDHLIMQKVRHTVVDAELGEFLGTDPVSSDFSKEDSVDGSHGNCRCPTVVGPCAREALRAELLECRRQQMYKCGSDDDTRTKVLGESASQYHSLPFDQSCDSLEERPGDRLA